MANVKDLWLKFNEYSNKLATALGRTSNIVGEYAEYLTVSQPLRWAFGYPLCGVCKYKKRADLF
jgi:hypothetical protein